MTAPQGDHGQGAGPFRTRPARTRHLFEKIVETTPPQDQRQHKPHASAENRRKINQHSHAGRGKQVFELHGYSLSPLGFYLPWQTRPGQKNMTVILATGMTVAIVQHSGLSRAGLWGCE